MTQLSTLAHEERDSVTAFLQAQRNSVLAIVEGLGEEQMRRSVVPSGWTALGLVGHLRDAERHWFEAVIAGSGDVLEDEPEAIGGPFVSDRPFDEVISCYQDQIARSDKILADTSLDASPVGRVWPKADEIHTVRDVVLHMIEETARHAGHLDIARELTDGSTGLGPR
jgi:uncharacterized damage-inducible protein DinB